MHETAAEQKESRSPEAPADVVILFILMNTLFTIVHNKPTSTLSHINCDVNNKQDKELLVLYGFQLKEIDYTLHNKK